MRGAGGGREVEGRGGRGLWGQLLTITVLFLSHQQQHVQSAVAGSDMVYFALAFLPANQILYVMCQGF